VRNFFVVLFLTATFLSLIGAISLAISQQFLFAAWLLLFGCGLVIVARHIKCRTWG